MHKVTQTAMPMPTATRSTGAAWMALAAALPTTSPTSAATNSEAPSGCRRDRRSALARACSKRWSAWTRRVSPTGPFCPRRVASKCAVPRMERDRPTAARDDRKRSLHPWIVCRVGVHGRAAVGDGVGAQFVVPGFVAVDPAQPVLGAVGRQPGGGVGGADVDRAPRYVSGRVGGGHPPGRFRFRAVLRDRLVEQVLLVLPGTPAAVDEELDAVVRGPGRRPAQRAEEISVEVGHARDVVVEDRRAVGD